MDGFVIKNEILLSSQSKDPLITVPYGVKEIACGAFKGSSSLLHIALPETVKVIGNYAFKGCRNLKTILIPEQLTFIGEYAFHRCHSLQKIELPPSVKKLGSCAFLYCDSLESISMPGVEELGIQAFINDIELKYLHLSGNLSPLCICDVFTGCSKLSHITFEDGTAYQFDNIIAALNCLENLSPIVKAIVKDVARMMKISDGTITEFLTNIKELRLPEGITAIGKSCFSEKRGILSVAFPKSLKKIGSNAFTNCIGLERIEFGSKDVQISKDGFKNCSNLKSISFTHGKTFELNGIEMEEECFIPELVKTVQAQILNNFLISGTILLQYLGLEKKVQVPYGITQIGPHAFGKNEAIDRVILPETVEEIGQEAFHDCLLLQTISLPKGLKRIKKAAFINCIKLIRMELPDTLKEIEESVFNRCKSLREITFGKELQSIHNLSFYRCEALEQVKFPDTLSLLGDLAFYHCSSLKEVYLPSSIQTIGNQVFANSSIQTATLACSTNGISIFSQCCNLKTLVLKEGVVHIGEKLAFDCENLTTVELPSSIRTIGRHAFEKSIYLKYLEGGIAGNILIDGTSLSGTVVIEEGILAIAGGAFYGNTKITAIHIPNTIEWIGERAFCGCTKIREIQLPEKVNQILEGTFDGCHTLTRISALGKIECIGKYAFYGCCNLQKVLFKGCSCVKAFAFYGCSALENFSFFNQKHIQIEEYAMEHTRWYHKQTTSKKIIYLSSTLIDGRNVSGKIIIPEGILYIAPNAFYCNDTISSIELPESIFSIGEGAFFGCKNLKQVIFKGAVSKIGDKAFEKCIHLKYISCRVQIIGNRAFAWCKDLEEAEFSQTEQVLEQVIGEEAFRDCTSLKQCKFEKVKEIPKECFSNCSSLKEFDFNWVSFIRTRAFYSCNSMISLVFPKATMVEDYAFENCGHIQNILIQKENFQFDSYAFSGCTSIKEIQITERCFSITDYDILFEKELPQMVKSLYSSIVSCFQINENKAIIKYLNNGTTVSIPNGIKEIAPEAFRDAINLTELTLPDSLLSIGARAFAGTNWLDLQREKNPLVVINNILIDGFLCKGKTVIPENVKRIAGWAFANCFTLTELVFLSDEIKVEELSFRNCIYLKSVTLADQRAYKLNCISDLEQEFPSLVKAIFKECFNCFKIKSNGVLIECTGNISELFLPVGITEIADKVFEDSNLLTCITLSNSVVSIGNSAFLQCKWLSCVKQGFSIETIGKKAFSGCIRLKKVEFSDKLHSIGAGAFEHCTLLEEIILPEGITEIKEKTFYRCHNLKKVVLPSTLKSIGTEAFAFCYSLKEIHFPDQLVTIGSRAFAWCNLEEKE